MSAIQALPPAASLRRNSDGAFYSSTEHVTRWLDEAVRAAENAASLPPAAREAVNAVLDALAAEDGTLPPEVTAARAILARKPATLLLTVRRQSRATQQAPSLAETLLTAVRPHCGQQPDTRDGLLARL